MENNPSNPLNTGATVPPTTPATQTTTTAQSQTAAVPTTPPPPLPVPATSANPPDNSSKVKKYIIAGVAVLALLTTAYVGYTFFKKPTFVIEADDLKNKLSTETDSNETTESPADIEKLNNVVNELKDQYKTPDSGTPPSINIQAEEPISSNPAKAETAENSSTENSEIADDSSTDKTTEPENTSSTSTDNTVTPESADSIPPNSSTTKVPR